MKICFHVDESARWPVALGNVANTLKAFREAPRKGEKIAIVVNAEAVRQLTVEGARAAGLEEAFCDAIAGGVRIEACLNALTGHGIEEEDLLPGVLVIPAGIIALAEKQSQGFAYIRP